MQQAPILNRDIVKNRFHRNAEYNPILHKHSDLTFKVTNSNDELTYVMQKPSDMSYMDRKTIALLTQDLRTAGIELKEGLDQLTFSTPSTVNNASRVKSILNGSSLKVTSEQAMLTNYFKAKHKPNLLYSAFFRNHKLYDNISKGLKTFHKAITNKKFPAVKVITDIALWQSGALKGGIDVKHDIKHFIVDAIKHPEELETAVKASFDQIAKRFQTDPKFTLGDPKQQQAIELDIHKETNQLVIDFKSDGLNHNREINKTLRKVALSVPQAKVVNDKIYIDGKKELLQQVSKIMSKQNLKITHIPNQKLKAAILNTPKKTSKLKSAIGL